MSWLSASYPLFERLQRGQKLNRKQRREGERRLNAADPGLEIVNRDAAGMDVGNESHYVAVPPGRDEQPVREFGSWTAALEDMAQWLLACRIRAVALQSTGVYWMALYDVLQRYGLEVNLVDARGTKNVLGRKLHTYGLLRACFLPSPQIHQVRTVWRLRDQNVKEAGREIQHMQKALIEMNVQLHIAISDLSGVTGQAIIRAILAGERDPHALAGLRDCRIQASEEEIAHSLQGNWKADVLFELQQAVAAYDFYRRQMVECDRRLQQYMAALPSAEVAPANTPEADTMENGKTGRFRKLKGNQPAFDLEPELTRILGVNAKTIDGIDLMTIETVLAEVGPDLRAWKTEAHWSSWLNLAPKRGRQRRKGDSPRTTTSHQPRGQRLSDGGSVPGAQPKLSGCQIPLLASEAGRTQSRQGHGPHFSLPLLSIGHQGPRLGGPGRRRI